MFTRIGHTWYTSGEGWCLGRVQEDGRGTESMQRKTKAGEASNSVMFTLSGVVMSILPLFRRICNINRRVESRKKLEHKILARREMNKADTLWAGVFAPVE